MAITLTISDTLFARLCEVAEEYEPLSEDFCANDFAGGNVDDAWWGGVSYGEEQLARVLIDSNRRHTLHL